MNALNHDFGVGRWSRSIFAESVVFDLSGLGYFFFFIGCTFPSRDLHTAFRSTARFVHYIPGRPIMNCLREREREREKKKETEQSHWNRMRFLNGRQHKKKNKKQKTKIKGNWLVSSDVEATTKPKQNNIELIEFVVCVFFVWSMCGATCFSILIRFRLNCVKRSECCTFHAAGGITNIKWPMR